ncbi:hypothetical protein PV772_03560 [Pseudarthrobacter sp. CC12]|uniref:hypothetical protein n=1 Tax=Pseudarthrobacter sp. CC12 TaxID=3029193 RepID=UPI003263E2CE
MKKHYPIAAGLIVAALSLSACGGTTPAADASPTATVSPTPSPTPTATVAQFASILTEQEKNWRDYNDNITTCAFASISTKPLDQMQALTCKFSAMTVTLTAKTAAKNIRALPTPPAEISSLRTRTLSALDDLAAIDATTACKDTESQACDDAETLANGAIRPLISVLDAWRPYTK